MLDHRNEIKFLNKISESNCFINTKFIEFYILIEIRHNYTLKTRTKICFDEKKKQFCCILFFFISLIVYSSFILKI